jgi:hypothetical protein
MAQVISAPGQSQPFGTLAVAPGPVQAGASQTRATSTATTVTYNQSEPGWGEKGDASKPKRS